MRNGDRLHRPVLVLNASFEPINICAARRAIVLVLKGVATAEEQSHLSVRSALQSIRLPSVIRLLGYRRIPHQTRALSRKNILIRDRFTCQYCQLCLDRAGYPGWISFSLYRLENEPWGAHVNTYLIGQTYWHFLVVVILLLLRSGCDCCSG